MQITFFIQEQEIYLFIKKSLCKPDINWGTLLPLTIIYSIFLVVGVSGNIVTCIVITKNEYMRTATNVYLLNLAIIDIATLLLGKLLFYHNLVHNHYLTPSSS